MSKKSTTVPITPSLLSTFVPRKTFNRHQGASITSLDFDISGQFLLSAGVDKSIQVYDIHKGVHTKEIQSQKYGAHVARFTHKELNCLYASTPEASGETCDNGIRYVSLSDKKYIRYFKGHKSQVTALEVNPVHDTFISSGYDNTVKLWDHRSPNPTGSLGVDGPGLVAWDPYGIVFAVATTIGDEWSLSFYDTKHYHQAPFLTARITTKCRWTHIEFSNTGSCVLVCTDGPEQYIVDAFSGKLTTSLVSETAQGEEEFKSTYPITATACFSPCGRYVVRGTPRSTLEFYDLTGLHFTNGKTLKEANPEKLQPYTHIGTNQGVPKILTFNPKLLTLATADNCVTMWQPERHET